MRILNRERDDSKINFIFFAFVKFTCINRCKSFLKYIHHFLVNIYIFKYYQKDTNSNKIKTKTKGFKNLF